MKKFEVKSGAFNDQRPTGCSWHPFGNVELWESSSGVCNVNNYGGCFCLKAQGNKKDFIFSWPNMIQKLSKRHY